MENNASSAGVLHGGLFNIAEIRILICYILSSINEPVPVNMLANTLHYEGIANAFEVCDAIVSLSKTGQVYQVDPKEDTYAITDDGRSVANELNTTLSMTVKERAYLASIKMFTKYKNAKSAKFEITKEAGHTYLNCTAIDNEIPLISVKMLVFDEMQASAIKEKFLENPSAVFSNIIETLTKKK